MKDETLNQQQENQNKPANNDNEQKPYLSGGNEDKQNSTNENPSQQQRPYNPNYQQRPYNPNYQQRNPNQQQRPYNPNYQQRDPNQQQRPYNPNYQQRDPNQQQRPYNPNYQQRDPNQQQRPYNPNYQQRDPNQQQRPYNPNYQQRDPNQQQRPYNPNYQQRDPNQQQRPYNPNYQQRDPNQQQRPYNPNYQQRNNNRFGTTGGSYNRPQGGGYNQNPYGNNRNRPQQRTNNTRNQYFQTPQAPPSYQEETPTNIRLNRFIASAGICSRRKADELIKNGEIIVNGNPITEMGYKITPQDVVTYQDKNINPEKKVYILLNKPKNTITTTDDPKERPTVMSLIKNPHIDTTRLYPIGRLDRNTTGLLLLTNDGDLAQNLSHPSREVLKVYQATLDKPLTKVDFDTIANGLELEDGFIKVDAIAYPDLNDKTQVGVEIHSGRNRIVRRIFEHLGYKVKKLDRTAYASLNKRNIPRSKWRFLSVLEVLELKNYDYEKQKTQKYTDTHTTTTTTTTQPTNNYRRPTSAFIDDNDAELL